MPYFNSNSNVYDSKSLIMKHAIVILSVCLFLKTTAQKKVIPVTQSVLTGVLLPNGSTQDKRFLIELSAKILLEMESKKSSAGVKTTEVLSLPASAVFNTDSLSNQLIALGWMIIPVATDKKYFWLQKDSRFVLTYFSIDKKETALYFGETETPPVINGNGTR